MSSEQFDFLEQKPATKPSTPAAHAPLAFRMRPSTLDNYFGHQKLLNQNSPLKTWIEKDQIPSMIFWGPPGCGKTTLAKVIAQKTKSRFVGLSAVLSGVKDLKQTIQEAHSAQRLSGKKTILFVDEIHRFNKSQQDALLPHVEEGTVTLIGATTENPSFEVNSALLSRCRVLRFEQLDFDAMESIIRRAISDPDKGTLSRFKLTEESVRFLIEYSDGDARKALNSLDEIDLALSHENSQTDTPETLTPERLKNLLESNLKRPPLSYDKNGEEHYNVISAFIKSVRDSDPDAAVYYLARMLEGGEDPKFICRRLLILASEDIGNADPDALVLASSTQNAVHFVGLPEARIILSQLTIYLANAPKENIAMTAVDAAISEVRQSGSLPVPMHLRNAVTGLMKKQGYGQGYRYAHHHGGERSNESNLPEKIRHKRFVLSNTKSS